MAFEGLTQRLQQAFGKVRGKGSLTEEDVKLVMREVRMALLEADVNYKVVKDFVKKATERCIGQEAQNGLSTQQQVITARRRFRYSCSAAFRARARRRCPPSWQTG